MSCIRIGVVTTSRADYGIYRPILKSLVENSNFDLELYVTGTHLLKEWGMTVGEIVNDGFPIAARLPGLESGHDPESITRSMGNTTIQFGAVFAKSAPDYVMVLGDRFEMHAAAIAAVPFRLPIIHIHGGELTYGSFDDLFRHSLTKMSHLHCASTQEYADRIIQMGEEPWRVIVSGAPTLDELNTIQYLTPTELESRYQIQLRRQTILVTFHPVTMEYEHTGQYIQALLAALEKFPDASIIFTSPNVDTNWKIIATSIQEYVQAHANAFIIKNFGQQGYFSMMKYASMMVGNSSSGLIEAASFHLPVVNIGTRQDGRIRNENVIDVGYTQTEISSGIERVISPVFKESLLGIQNSYGDGRASERIISFLETVDVKRVIHKKFYDLPQPSSHFANK